MLVMEDAELSDASEELALLSLVGPKAAELSTAVVTEGRAHGAVERPGLAGAALLVPRSDVQRILATLSAAGATQPGQLSMSATAAAFELPTRKSSAPSAVR